MQKRFYLVLIVGYPTKGERKYLYKKGLEIQRVKVLPLLPRREPLEAATAPS
jgi:hypothetical protein